MSTLVLLVGLVTGVLILLFVVVGTLVELGKLGFFVEYHFHQLLVQQNLRIYHKTKGFMMETGVREEENEKLYRFYTENFDISRDLELREATRTIMKDGKEVQEEVRAWYLTENHSESESASFNDLETPGFFFLIWSGLVVLSFLSLVTVFLTWVGSIRW